MCVCVCDWLTISFGIRLYKVVARLGVGALNRIIRGTEPTYHNYAEFHQILVSKFHGGEEENNINERIHSQRPLHSMETSLPRQEVDLYM